MRIFINKRTRLIILLLVIIIIGCGLFFLDRAGHGTRTPYPSFAASLEACVASLFAWAASLRAVAESLTA